MTTLRPTLPRLLPTAPAALLALLALGIGHAEPLVAALLPESVIEYEIRDQVATIVGTAPLTTLELSFDDDDVRGAELRATLDPARFASGNFLRDSDARRTVFEVEEFPLIAFEAFAVDADPVDLPAGASRELLLRGRLDLHGVAREISVPVTAERSGDLLTVEGSFELLLSEHEMVRPRVLFVVVEDRVVVRLRIVATLSGGD